MVDDEDAEDQPFYSPGRRPSERREQPGVKAWELRRGDRVLVCELRDDERAGAGVDVQVLDADRWPLMTQRCANRDGAAFVAASYRRELLRRGWIEA